MKAVWAAAALLVGLGFLAVFALTRPREVWVFEFRSPSALLRAAEFRSGTPRDELIPVLSQALEEAVTPALPVVVLRWADEKRTRRWVSSWPPLRTASHDNAVGKLILRKRPNGRWAIPADGLVLESTFDSSREALDEALRRLLPPD